MAQIAHTTKVHVSAKKSAEKKKAVPVEVELDTEAIALAKRVSARLKQPTPTVPQAVIEDEDEYEPQDILVPPKKR